ncbi:MAG: hypothetical protein RLZZ387_3915 [Chloroflexota bacterium]
MPDDAELLRLLSRPRPSGSLAERETYDMLRAWLDARGISCERHPFRLRPYFFEAVGAWLIASRTLLAVAALRGWGWRAVPIALVGQAGGAADILGFPLITWPGARDSESLTVSFGPTRADRELIIAAHYDSKTELLDHQRRALLLRGLRPGIALTFAAALFAAAEGELRARQSPLQPLARALSIAAAVPVALLAWALGLNLLLGRAASPSAGAVDDGAACVVLLRLAERLAAHKAFTRRTRVTLAIFGGEEVNMQGAATYVRFRFPQPINTPRAAVVNLELLGQRGPYVLWERDGNALRTLPTTPEINQLLHESIMAVTESTPAPEPLINSDAYPFLAAGVPAAVLGTRDPVLGTGGLHRPTDSVDRIDLARLPEHVAVLEELIRRYDDASLFVR